MDLLKSVSAMWDPKFLPLLVSLVVLPLSQLFAVPGSTQILLQVSTHELSVRDRERREENSEDKAEFSSAITLRLTECS